MSYKNSIVGYWPLDETDGSDSTAYDHSGNENHGTASGAGPTGTGTTSAPLGSTAYVFDGSSDRIDLDSIPALSNGYTISAWVKCSEVSGNNTIIDIKGTNNDIQTQVYSGSLRLQQYDGSSWNTLAGGSPSNGEWFLYTARWNGAVMELYQNGVKKASQAVSSHSASGTYSVRIGEYGAPGGYNLMNGAISNIVVWKRALSPQEIAYLYEVSERGRLVTQKKTS